MSNCWLIFKKYVIDLSLLCTIHNHVQHKDMISHQTGGCSLSSAIWSAMHSKKWQINAWNVISTFKKHQTNYYFWFCFAPFEQIPKALQSILALQENFFKCYSSLKVVSPSIRAGSGQSKYKIIETAFLFYVIL